MTINVENPPHSTAVAALPRNGSDAAASHPSRERAGWQCVGEVNILILDDDRSVCDLMTAALSHPNYLVEVESEPTQIEYRLQSKRYHLIILDYVLPGVQPEQVFSWVQRHQPDVSIIVVTGYPSMDSALNCLRARTFDYITKPFQVTQLQDTVTRCLESKGLLRMSEEALKQALGAVIRERRKGRGLTLAQLTERTRIVDKDGNKSGVSLGYLSQIELGKNSASIEMLYRISLGLGIKLADLFQAVEETMLSGPQPHETLASGKRPQR
jgi:DNA-binding response OmpR family regulator